MNRKYPKDISYFYRGVKVKTSKIYDDNLPPREIKKGDTVYFKSKDEGHYHFILKIKELSLKKDIIKYNILAHESKTIHISEGETDVFSEVKDLYSIYTLPEEHNDQWHWLYNNVSWRFVSESFKQDMAIAKNLQPNDVFYDVQYDDFLIVEEDFPETVGFLFDEIKLGNYIKVDADFIMKNPSIFYPDEIYEDAELSLLLPPKKRLRVTPGDLYLYRPNSFFERVIEIQESGNFKVLASNLPLENFDREHCLVPRYLGKQIPREEFQTQIQENKYKTHNVKPEITNPTISDSLVFGLLGGLGMLGSFKKSLENKKTTEKLLD